MGFAYSFFLANCWDGREDTEHGFNTDLTASIE